MGIAKEVGPGLRLTALHLVGFKSFADKTELRFGPGVTAIVGPNGSGKSNVVDAVRWVLGEQNTRSLRSDRVTQLIFAGTERRNPLGLAQAALVLDNSEQRAPLEYSELHIVRRVYRSGESEFLINGTPCRLRDIQQLLLGTGLGRGGMAVVGQGEIDAILSARPADRRQLLEETAGTSRYRAQQRTAEQRLERARQDLARVRDLIVELSARVDTLEAQAAAARRYKEIVGLLQRQRAARASREWIRAVERHGEALRQVVEGRKRLAALEHEAAAAREAAARGREELDGAGRRREAARTSLQEMENAKSELDHRLQLLKLQWQAAEERRVRAGEERERQRNGETAALELRRELESVLGRELEHLEGLRRTAEEAAEQLSAFDRRHKGEAARAAAMRDELITVLQKTARLRNELQQLDEQIRHGSEAKERTEHDRRSMQMELARVRKELNEARADAERGALALKDAEEEDRRLALQLQQAREGLASASKEAETLRSRRQETEATRRALERLESAYAGYRPAVKAVLSSRPPVEGVLGTVGQLLDVPERFELPVQVALGAATQFIVAERETAVTAAIELLRRQRAGRATFLSLDALRPRPWPADGDKLLAEAGVLGRASDLVGFEGRLLPVIQYLLGRVVVVDELRRAQALARTVNSSLRLVTMQGDLLTPGGPVTGGFQGSQSVDGTLSRRRELRHLGSQMSELNRRLQEAVQRAEAAQNAVDDLEEEIARRKSANTAQVIEQARQHQRALQAEAERQRLEAALGALDARDAAWAEKREEASLRGEQLRNSLRAAEGRERDLRLELERMAKAEQERDGERRRLAESAAAGRAALAGREEAVRGLQRRIADAAEEQEKAAAETRRFAELERTAALEGQGLQREMDELQHRMPAAEAQIQSQRLLVAEAEQEQARLREELERLETAAGRKAREAAEAKERVWSMEATLARLESSVDSCVQRLRELNVSEEDAERIVREREPGADVRALEEELHALGSVHLGAEEELQEIGQRLQFLLEQQNDLEQAGLSLEEVIQRLDKVSEERFAVTLSKVAGEFDGIFRRLFGGGRGSLVMSEDGEGVDVHVQMPGKRTQHLLALSGGERALTAIALLFAILRVQPSPFYVLDEIDSALDEANLERFQQLLREAAREAQFIVITHRATTMEVCDALYGVTASEPGVSTVISLDLQSAVASIA